MSKYLHLFYKILIRQVSLVLGSPPSSPIIVFDNISIQDLRYITSKFDHFILETRPLEIKKIYISFGIIYNFFFLLCFRKNNLSLVDLYFVALIKIINPKIILTFIDNSSKFFNIAKTLEKEIIFLAIQNAARYDFKINEYKFLNKLISRDDNKNFFLPHYFCFGGLEKYDSNKYSLKIKNFYEYGSLRLANFFKFLEEKQIKLENNYYDICMISEPIFNKNNLFKTNNIEEGFSKLAKYLIKFSKKKNLNFIFVKKYNKIKKSDAVDDMDFYNNFLDQSEIDYLNLNTYKDHGTFSSYMGVFQSKVAIGTQSTLLREKIGCGQKILSVNLTNKEFWNFPVEGLCTLNNCSFSEFEERLSYILNINNRDYFNQISKDKSFLMNFDENNSAINKINSKINSYLND